MKKQPRKLALNVETVRQLTSREVHVVHGGAISQPLSLCCHITAASCPNDSTCFC